MPEIEESKILIKEAKYAKAEPLLQRSLEIAEFAIGKDDVEYKKLVEMLLECYYKMHRNYLAVNLFGKVIVNYIESDEKKAQLLIMQFSNSFLKIDYDELKSKETQDYLESLKKLTKSPDLVIQIYTFQIKITTLKMVYFDNNQDISQDDKLTRRLELFKQINTFFQDANSLVDQITDNFVKSQWDLTIARCWYYYYSQVADKVAHDEILQSKKKLLAALETLQQPVLSHFIEPDLVKSDIFLALGEIESYFKNWHESETFLNKSIDLADRHFDRDSQRVRKIIEKMALVQFHLNRWIHAEGLLRRLINYYLENNIPNQQGFIEKSQFDCMKSYCDMMDIRGRGNESENIKRLLDSVTFIKSCAPFDSDAFKL